VTYVFFSLSEATNSKYSRLSIPWTWHQIDGPRVLGHRGSTARQPGRV